MRWPRHERGAGRGAEKVSALGVIPCDLVETVLDVTDQIRVVDLGHDIDQTRVISRGDDPIGKAFAQIGMGLFLKRAGAMARRQCDSTQHLDPRRGTQPQLMPKAFRRIRAVSQLDDRQPSIGPGDPDEIDKGSSRRPARPAARAIDLPPVHVDPHNTLLMPASMFIEPVIVIAFRIARDQGPALFPGAFCVA